MYAEKLKLRSVTDSYHVEEDEYPRHRILFEKNAESNTVFIFF